jgi:transcription initiation factor TFIIIB Brf1 subunit/transcription initiation factor TFIIB
MAFFACPACASQAPTVELDGSEWCQGCGIERDTCVIGGDDLYATTVVPVRPQHREWVAAPSTRRHVQSETHISRDLSKVLNNAIESINIPKHVADTAIVMFRSLGTPPRAARSNMQRQVMAECLQRATAAHNVARSSGTIKSAMGIVKRTRPRGGIMRMYTDGASKAVVTNAPTNLGFTSDVYAHCRTLPDAVSSRIATKSNRLMENLYANTSYVHGKHPRKIAACVVFLVCVHEGVKICDAHTVVTSGFCKKCFEAASRDFDIGTATLSTHYRAIHTYATTFFSQR